MRTEKFIQFKAYLYDGDETEGRRFQMASFHATSYCRIISLLLEIFPGLSSKSFLLSWKDEDGDDILISSDEELLTALLNITSNVKQLYIRIKNGKEAEKTKKGPGKEVEHFNILHLWVSCNVCQQDIVGFRYKCLICMNYDLCNACDKNGLHAEHPMLRLATPYLFKQSAVHELMKVASSNFDERKHQHAETDDSEEGFHKKHGHGKSRKHRPLNVCEYFVEKYMHYVNYFYLQTLCNKQEAADKLSNKLAVEPLHSKYVKTIPKIVTALLDLLGVDVDIEVRSTPDKEENEKSNDAATKKEPSQSNVTSSANKKENELSEGADSERKQQKEVHFEIPQEKNKTAESNVGKVAESSEKDD